MTPWETNRTGIKLECPHCNQWLQVALNLSVGMEVASPVIKTIPPVQWMPHMGKTAVLEAAQPEPAQLIIDPRVIVPAGPDKLSIGSGVHVQ